MNAQQTERVEEVKARLIEMTARITQDFGMGRIVGQVMACVYLTEQEVSLDEIGEKLGLSKAAVSIATRRLESLELLRRAWRKGDKKHYYRTADNFRTALQRGVMAMIEAKIRVAGEELDRAGEALADMKTQGDGETQFLRARVDRARKMRDRAVRILDNPVVRFMGRPGIV